MNYELKIRKYKVHKLKIRICCFYNCHAEFISAFKPDIDRSRNPSTRLRAGKFEMIESKIALNFQIVEYNKTVKIA